MGTLMPMLKSSHLLSKIPELIQIANSLIIPSVDGVDNQFTLLVTTEGPAESRNTAMLTVEALDNCL